MKDKFIRRTELLEVTGLSATTIWRLEKSGNFPARRQTSPNSVSWIESEVQSWLESRQPVISETKNHKQMLKPPKAIDTSR